MKLGTIIAFIAICFAVAITFSTLYTKYTEWMKKKIKEENEYDMQYQTVQEILELWVKEDDLQMYFENEFSALLCEPHKNHEKSEVLYHAYLKKCEELGVKPNIVNPNID